MIMGPSRDRRYSTSYEELSPLFTGQQPKFPKELPEIIYGESKNCIKDFITDEKVAPFLDEFNAVQDLEKLIMQVLALTGAKDNNGSTIAHLAIERGNVSMLKLIIYIDPKLIHEKSNGGIAPLHLAAMLGQDEAVEWLLNPANLGTSEKANIEDVTVEKQTALHKALFYGQTTAARKLVKHGANKDTLDCHGLTPMDLATYKLYSIDPRTSTSYAKDPLFTQKYAALKQEFAPDRRLLTLEEITKALNHQKAAS